MLNFNIFISLWLLGALTGVSFATVVSPISSDTLEQNCNYTSPEAKWRKSCNWCSCSTTGVGICTLKLCLSGTETRPRDEPDCTGDATWKKNCNWCFCHQGRGICTSKYCGPLPPRGGKIEKRMLARRISGGFASSCKSVSEGGSWRDDCNWCRCLNDTALCTKKLCNPVEIGEKSAGTSDCNGEVEWQKGCERCACVDGYSVCSLEECEAANQNRNPECVAGAEGGRWRKDCNWCNCGEGLPMCTRRGCRPSDFLRDSPVCEGEITWKEDCNWCRCIEGKAKCTVNDCGITSKNNQKCEKGQAWVEGCNNCFCNKGAPFCTRRACARAPVNDIHPVVLGKRVAEVSELAARSDLMPGECSDGSRWMKGCNWCSCSNGTGICTLRACAPGYEDKIKPPFCDENSKWKDDCNFCRCANGVPVCTRKGCKSTAFVPQIGSPVISRIPQRDAREAMCTENSRWKIACNWCTCSNGFAACTIMGCLSGFRDQGPVCDDGSEWRARDRTWCKCEDGRAVCQKESTDVVQDTLPVPRVNMGSECTDGSRWRQNCNWCTCSGGRGICSLRACISAFQDDGDDCEVGSQWRRPDCSWCHCEEGKSSCQPSTCTPGASSSTSVREIPSVAPLSRVTTQREPTCTDGSRWTKLCNWCTCSNGIGLCEQRACLSESAKEMDRTCEGEAKWKEGCNWCTCENGKGSCTNNDCSQGVINDAVPQNDETCISGNSWMQDCNICVCTNASAVCTKMACSPEGRNVERCTDGDVWMDDCNSCQCVDGEGACTKKLCPTVRHTSQLAALCYLPAVDPNAKLCGGFETKWTFNVEARICENVIYGGCGGTDNLFNNEKECLITCGTNEPIVEIANLEKDPKERCFLPVVPGPCFASKIRFAFFPERNRCEKFFYGGCQGNENNFENVDECYQICGGNPPVMDPECDRSKCDWKRYGHYLGQGCEPIYEGESCCPTRFECKSEEEKGMVTNKCYYKGKEFQIGEEIPVEDECSANCKCVGGFNESPAEVTCAAVECPSLFRRPNPQCRLRFTPGQCCETDTECVDPSLPQAHQRSAECHWNKNSWKLGDKMFFADEPCKSCICTENFTNPSGPGCKQISCGFDFRYRNNYIQGCVPLYFEERCCSIDWICPGDRRLENAEIQNNQLNSQEGDSFATCKLGDLAIPVGGSLKLSSTCQIKCDCKTPPGLTCVKYTSCENTERNQALNLRSKGARSLSMVTTSFSCKEPVCPPACRNPSIELDTTIGCQVCKCECRKDFRGRPHCPQDCAVKIIFDEQTGCDKCICDRNNPVNPFSRP